MATSVLGEKAAGTDHLRKLKSKLPQRTRVWYFRNSHSPGQCSHSCLWTNGSPLPALHSICLLLLLVFRPQTFVWDFPVPLLPPPPCPLNHFRRTIESCECLHLLRCLSHPAFPGCAWRESSGNHQHGC